MNKKEIHLRVLHLEDNARDHELIREILANDEIHCDFCCVKNRPEFETHLQREEFDVILSDFAMPGYDGLSALEAARHTKPETPFIFVSGTIGEERAVESLKNGATDYVIKGNLHRLAPAIMRALREAKERAERRRTQESLRESEALYQSLVENLPQNIFRKDLAGRFTFANRRFCEFIGKPLPDVLGKTDTDLFPRELAERYQADDKRIVETGESFESVEESEITAGTKKFIQTVKTPLRGANGQIIGVQGIFWDVTEKKKVEAQSLRGQRLESLGTLAGGIAHDLNNVLAPIMMSIEILRLKYSDAGAERILATIESSAQRGAEMVKQVLTFARGVQGERVTIQVGHLIKEIGKILKQTFPKAIETRAAIANQLWPTVGDATQLHQVLMNLCVNARDAMPDGGTLNLEASNFVIDESFASMNAEAKPGPYVTISIKDTGTGIPAHVLERIFEPFFSTKSLEKGTGLGLSTVRGIVKSHEGFVKVYTEVGKGSEFRVFLPAQESNATVRVAAQHDALPTGHGEIVLVVDDEAAILNIAKQTLEAFGYHVLTADDGAQAIGLCANSGSGIKVMVTDMMMPVLDGPSAIKGIRRVAPTIKIIATSGMDQALDLTSPNQLQIDAVLQKPYTTEQLLKTVHRVLSGEDAPGSKKIGETTLSSMF